MSPAHVGIPRPSRSTLPGALALVLSLPLAAGCADAADPAPVSARPLAEPLPLPEQSVVIAEIVAHVSPSKGTITFERLDRGAPSSTTQSIDELNLVESGAENDGPPTTVELVTNTVGYDAECPAPYQISTFCGNVTLRSFYTRSLSNVFVQVTSIDPPTGHNALNSDPSEFALEDTFGLWKYKAPAAASPGVLGEAPHNDGSRDWVFANADGTDSSIFLRVVASLKYAEYTLDYSSASFIDACAGGAATGLASGQQTLPFPFTLYNSTNTVVRYNSRGMITFGNVSGTSIGLNTALPSSRAPKPGVFVFWDNIKYGLGGKMCYKVVGAAPNRKAVITWNNMTFTDAPDSNTASLQFGAILSEGTNNIDVVYQTMSGMTSRVTGDSATVGVQDELNEAATVEYNQGNFGAGSAYTFVPIP